MITSALVKIKNTEVVSTEYIETELQKMEIEPLRWAIVEVDENDLTISIAYERK